LIIYTHSPLPVRLPPATSVPFPPEPCHPPCQHTTQPHPHKNNIKE
jgi:hypothetical protein